jgi:hypothetical protein
MSENSEYYRENGFLVLPGVLSEAEVNEYTRKIEGLAGSLLTETDILSYALPFGVSKHREFWDILWHDRIVSHLRDVVDPDIRFGYLTGIHYNITPEGKFDGDPHKVTGWHRDTRYRANHCRVGDRYAWGNSLDDLKFVRVGIYLNSYEENRCSVYFIPKSHRPEYSFGGLEWHFYHRYRQLKAKWSHNPAEIGYPYIRSKPNTRLCPPMPPFEFRGQRGDVVFFDARMIHGISTRRGPRLNLFLDYGTESDYGADHLNYYLVERKDMLYTELAPELVSILKEKNLYYDRTKHNPKSPLTGYHSIDPEPELLKLYGR